MTTSLPRIPAMLVLILAVILGALIQVCAATAAAGGFGGEMGMDQLLRRKMMDMEMMEFEMLPRTVAAEEDNEDENLQNFTGALGGSVAPPITNSGDSQRPYEVDGDTFTDFDDAQTRSCNNQHNSCCDIANASGDSSLTTGECDSQQTECIAAQSTAVVTTFGAAVATQSSTPVQVPTPEGGDPNFNYFCDAPLPT